MVLVLVGSIISYWFAGLGTFSSDVVGQSLIFGEQQVNGTILLGTILLTLLSGLITVFNAAAEIPRDIDSRMIAILLSKPISRQRYIWGKFLGTLGLGLICGLMWLTLMLICRQFLPIDEAEQLRWVDVVRQYACLLLLVPLTAVAISISCYFSDILAMVITCVYLLLCFVAAIFPVVISLTAQLVIGKILLLPYYLFPNLLYFLLSYPSLLDYAGLVVYALATAIIFLLLGRSRFNTGDIF